MNFDLLYYKDLDTTGLENKFKKVCTYLSTGDFNNADVRKLTTKSYYRAKLDVTNRLLFKPINYDNKTYLLLLEVIRNHNYDKSRFLRGAVIQETNIISPKDLIPLENDTIKFLQENQNRVHCLDRFLIFDEIQEEIFHYKLPMILIGSAGSGKTSLTLEKIKTINGDILYVTLSPFLTINARRIYYSNNYQNDEQAIDFLSFEELIETIAIPKGRELTIVEFLEWHQHQKKSKALLDGRKLYEEFRGVLSGSSLETACLLRENYLSLGVRQSIYAENERGEVYNLFQSYLRWLDTAGYFDSNILAYEYKNKARPRYDAVVIDEVQDFTNSQLSLVLSLLKQPYQFFMCGDANQIVHPNFFSWAGLKQLFYQDEKLDSVDITRILNRNYRNTPEVTELANRVLKIKNARFGSIDKESHYLIESQSKHSGDVACIKNSSEKIKEINLKIRRSINFAIIVLSDQQKKEACELFETPLVFSVQEAKGLEYENVILYRLLGREKKFLDIASGLSPESLNQEFKYGRAKDKTDKSLEIYKFYINSLYVAITRAIKSVYLIEDNPNHPLLALLNINEIKNSITTMDVRESSVEEWQKEANRLAQQGKTQQAKAIEQVILKQKKPNWVVIDNSMYENLSKNVFEQNYLTKKEQIDLFEMAMLYRDERVVMELQDKGLRAAQNLKKSYDIMYDKHFQKYSIKNTQPVQRDIQLYGVDHRTTANFTPLMSAIYTGNVELVNEILQLNPMLDAKDTFFKNALQIAIERAVLVGKKHLTALHLTYDSICVDSISLDVDGQLIKIDASRAEYFLLNLILALYFEMLAISCKIRAYDGFTAAELYNMVQKIPSSIWPEFRKKQAYLSSLLSRNEIDSSYIPNRKLFKRTSRGYYILNPELKFKTPTGWKVPKQILRERPAKYKFQFLYS